MIPMHSLLASVFLAIGSRGIKGEDMPGVC